MANMPRSADNSSVVLLCLVVLGAAFVLLAHFNRKLLEHFKVVEDHLGCRDGERKIRTLVPLCGKTHDLLW